MCFQQIKKYILPALIILISIFAVNVVFSFTERYDNKYSADQPGSDGGVLRLDEPWMASHPITPLVQGWEWRIAASSRSNSEGQTAGRLAFAASLPRSKTFIGQHGSFAGADLKNSPYGLASYYLSLSTPEQSEPYLLLLPEVFSACEVRVNGQPVRTLGSIDSERYQPFIKNILVSIPAGEAELMITAANYTHYYSGVTYPPLFGSMDAVESLVTHQLILYGFLCFFTLGAAIISLTVWVTHKEKYLYLLYGLMSVCFAVYISYPLTRFVGIRQVRFFYALEDISFYGMILCIVLTTQLLTGVMRGKLHQAAAAISLFFCILPGLTSFILAPMIPQWVNVSGHMIHCYKLAVSLYLIVTAWRGVFRPRHSLWLLCANSVFAMGILRDCRTAGLFEPIRGLWQTEYTSFLMILIFMALVIRHYRLLVLENNRLTLHLEDAVEKKTAHLTVLLNERRQLLSSIAHDMKAPIAVIRAYIELIRAGGVQIDEATDEYISIIGRKSSSLADQINTLQAFHEDDLQTGPPSICLLSDFLKAVSDEAGMYAEANGIYFHMELSKSPVFIRIQPPRLLRAMENIILNATESTPSGGNITLRGGADGEKAVITIRDSGCGIQPDDLPHIFDYQFSGKSEEEKTGAVRGLGLYFARNTILEQGGTIQVWSEPGLGTEFTITLPAVPRD